MRWFWSSATYTSYTNLLSCVVLVAVVVPPAPVELVDSLSFLSSFDFVDDVVSVTVVFSTSRIVTELDAAPSSSSKVLVQFTILNRSFCAACFCNTRFFSKWFTFGGTLETNSFASSFDSLRMCSGKSSAYQKKRKKKERKKPLKPNKKFLEEGQRKQKKFSTNLL